MEVTGYLPEGGVFQAAEGARVAEALGLRRVWTGELAHDPFLPLALAARDVPGMGLGTAVAIAFARTPWVTASLAWDLAEASGGDFVLGLGTQVRSHVRRRFGGHWESPLPWLRDYVGAMRAIWTSWSEGTPLRHEGPYFRLTLSSPRFDPGPIGVAPPPIYVAGVNRGLCALAGEIADGFLVHGLNSPEYIRERVLPILTRERERESLSVTVPVLVGTSADSSAIPTVRETMRRHVAFYASTPSYRPILEVHGVEGLGERLQKLAADGKWSAMPELVDDEVLELYAVCGLPGDVGRELVRRYEGLADEIALLHPVDHAEQDAWAGILDGIAKAHAEA